MLHKRRIIFGFVLFIASLGAFFAAAQTNEFKSKWAKLYDNVYFKNESLQDKLPEGQTEFGVFGFKDKREYPAKINISGNVTDARKDGKAYRYTMSNANVTIDNYDEIWKYQGNMVLSVSDELKDLVTLSITPLEGNFQVEDVRASTSVNYHIKPGWYEQMGDLVINVGKPEKSNPVPPFSVMKDNFKLPRHVTKNVDFTREISSDLQAGRLPLSDDDKIFIHSVLLPASRVEDVPGLRVVVSEMPLKNDPTMIFDSEVLYYMLGDDLRMSDAKVKRNGENYEITYRGAEPKYLFTAKYLNSAFPKFTSVKWDDGSTFDEDVLNRADRSRITGLKFDVKNNLLDMPQGFIIYQALALSEFNTPDFFDFNPYFKDEKIGRLDAGAYTSPENETTVILNGYIMPVRDRVEAERDIVRKAVSDEQRLYDNAKVWLEVRQKDLRDNYDRYSAGSEVFELPNNQAAVPHNVKVIRVIKQVGSEYEESFLINDGGMKYPLKFDGDGDPFYEDDQRKYGFTRVSEEARKYFDNLRIEGQNKKIVSKGRPADPKFD